MKLNITKTILLTVSCLLLTAMSSCTRVDLEDPLKGKITLITDWSKRTSGVEQPKNYSVIIADQTVNCTQASNCLPELPTGTYPIYIYNACDKIIIEGTTASVKSTDSEIYPLPGWLFTAVTKAVYTDFKEETITALMQQQVRKLTIILKPENGAASRIKSITANLSGMAGAWNFEYNKPTGKAMNAPLTFTKQVDGSWQATARLLGITGAVQKLTGTISFDGDSRTDISLNSDLSALLVNFNNDKTTPLSLQGDIKETPDEIGLGSNVTDWVKVDESVVAE